MKTYVGFRDKHNRKESKNEKDRVRKQPSGERKLEKKKEKKMRKKKS